MFLEAGKYPKDNHLLSVGRNEASRAKTTNKTRPVAGTASQRVAARQVEDHHFMPDLSQIQQMAQR